MTTVEVIANGERRLLAGGTTIAGLLESLGLPPARVAVEHNGTIVPRERYGETTLVTGDRLEVVTLVGGG